MRLFIIRLLLRLLSDETFRLVGKADSEKMDTWLMELSTESSGYKNYYSIRKKVINGVLGTGLEPREYWTNLGRLLELKQLNTLSMDVVKKYNKKYESVKKGQKQEGGESEHT